MKKLMFIFIGLFGAVLNAQPEFTQDHENFDNFSYLMGGPKDHEEETSYEDGKRADLWVMDHGFHIEDLSYSIELPRESICEIKLYSVEGQQVKTLQLATQMASGLHTFENNITGIDSGEYYLVVNSFTQSQAILITIL